MFSLCVMLLDAYTARDIHGYRGRDMVRLSEILTIHGQAQQAKKYLKQVIPLFEISLQQDQVQLCHDMIASLDDSL